MPGAALPRPDAARFELDSHWHLDAPIDDVWTALKRTEAWPRWWPYVKSVRELHAGDADGLGAVRHIAWGSRLPYGVAFEVEVVRMEPPRLLCGRARGQLDDTGTWTLRPEGATTRVHYRWCVVLSTPWMRRVAPLAAPVFLWNHNGVMRAGAQGLARHLGVRLLEVR